MNIRVIVEADDGAWRGQILLEPNGLTDEEQKSQAAHGNFEIEAGGEFSGAELTETPSLSDITFTLPENIVALPDAFPLIEVFSGVDADRMAATWVQVVQERLIGALTAWLALPETYERNTICTIP